MPGTTMEEFRTKDLSLAALLHMNGLSFRVELSGQDDGMGIFVFIPLSDSEHDDLQVIVDRYTGGTARVEPSRFVREVAFVRGKLYNFLGR